jgi:hypothetical protein
MTGLQPVVPPKQKITRHPRAILRRIESVHTFGEFLEPFIPCQMPPPMAPIANAPPKSLRTTHGLPYTVRKTSKTFMFNVPGVSCVVSMRHVWRKAKVEVEVDKATEKSSTMPQFTGFQGNILDTTPLKPNTAHGGDDLSISELSTTPQFRWMGEAAPATPRSEPEEVQDLSTSFQEESPEKDLEVSFDETLRFEASALDEGDAEADRTQTMQSTSHNNEAQELDLKYTLRTMNKTVLQLNGFLKACIPKFEVSGVRGHCVY